MAKTTCLSCGADMVFFNSKVQVSDGFICMECWMLAGYKNDMKSLMEARNYTARGLVALGTLGVSNLVWKKAKAESKSKTILKKVCLCQECGNSWFLTK